MYILYIFVIVLFLTIGIYQYNQKEFPVSFNTGETPMRREDVSDVVAYNRKHGILWISFSMLLAIGFILGTILNDPIWFSIITIVCMLGGIGSIFLCHRWLVNKYCLKEITKLDRSRNGWKLLPIGIGILSLLFTGIVLFSGKVEVDFGDNSLLLSATFVSSYEVRYDSIEKLEYVQDASIGNRDFGIGSFAIQAGEFSNSDWESYRLYSYVSCSDLVVVHTNKGILAFNAKDEALTKQYYEQLKSFSNKMQ